MNPAVELLMPLRISVVPVSMLSVNTSVPLSSVVDSSSVGMLRVPVAVAARAAVGKFSPAPAAVPSRASAPRPRSTPRLESGLLLRRGTSAR